MASKVDCIDTTKKNPFSLVVAQDDQSVGLQNAFNDHALRAIVYHFSVIVHEGQTYHPFQISCKIGDSLKINNTLLKMGVRWKGDLVVMHIGKRDPLRPVDMRGKGKLCHEEVSVTFYRKV